MILVIDNYDSFTYNLVQLTGKFAPEILVRRNDELSLEDIRKLRPAGILISPGPGRPENAGICINVVRVFGRSIPILGVCLGHQAIGAAFGGTITPAPSVMHGKTSLVRHSGRSIFTGVANPFKATRYHSLVISPVAFPSSLVVTARSDDGVIMAVRHREYPVEGVQFHPESILTEEGEGLIRNWLHEVKKC